VGWMAIAGMAMIPGRHDAAACKDIFYSFQNTITLNDTKIRAMFPDFAQTEMNKAIVDTLAWFRK